MTPLLPRRSNEQRCALRCEPFTYTESFSRARRIADDGGTFDFTITVATATTPPPDPVATTVICIAFGHHVSNRPLFRHRRLHLQGSRNIFRSQLSFSLYESAAPKINGTSCNLRRNGLHLAKN